MISARRFGCVETGVRKMVLHAIYTHTHTNTKNCTVLEYCHNSKARIIKLYMTMPNDKNFENHREIKRAQDTNIERS